MGDGDIAAGDVDGDAVVLEGEADGVGRDGLVAVAVGDPEVDGVVERGRELVEVRAVAVGGIAVPDGLVLLDLEVDGGDRAA